jgi:hypothetical protein
MDALADSPAASLEELLAVDAETRRAASQVVASRAG